MQHNVTIQNGIRLHRKGQVDAAATIYQKLLNKNPEDAQAMHYLGLVKYQKKRFGEAEQLINSSVQRDAKNANAWSDLGMVRIKTGALKKAINALSQALALAPEHPDALNNLAQAYRNLNQFDQARPLLERLAALKPNSSAVLRPLAEVQHKSSDISAAIETYHNAMRLDPNDRRIRLGLGDAYESIGKFKQAKMQYLSVLRREENDPAALARLLQIREGDIEPHMVKKAQTLADSTRTPEEGRVRLNIALGHYHDRQKDYDEAFRRLRLGYDVEAARNTFNSDGFKRAIDGLTAVLTADFYKTAIHSGVSSVRPIFIVGMPRSGTTLTEQILASHSRVSAGGELSMLLNVSYQIGELSSSGLPYPRGLKTVDQTGLRKMAQHYLKHLDKISSKAARVTDKLPFNFMHLGVIALIFPNARIVHCRRHPLDNCLSCYFTGFSDRIHFANQLDTLGQYYLEYDRLMQHWQRVLPIEIFDLQYEDLVNDTEPNVRSLLEYCSLDWEDKCLSFYDTQRDVRTPSRWQVRQPIYKGSVQRWHNYKQHLEPLASILAPLLQ